MSEQSDLDSMVRAAVRAGCRILRAKRHMVLAAPCGARIVVSMTPSNGREAQYLRLNLRRAGVEIDL